MSGEVACTCRYVREDGTTCPGETEEAGDLCFWHDPKATKEGAGIKERLQEWARTGESMEGFVLRFADLDGIRLSDDQGLNMRRAVLFRARLRGASLYNLDLRGADLFKADLSGANLNEAKMQGANLLGANFDGAKLERTEWGEKAIQEQKAIQEERTGDPERAHENYVEAEEVYRNLRRVYDSSGRFVEAGQFFEKEMTMRRKMLPRWSAGRIWSKLVDLFSGYGEEPQRVISFSMLIVILCAAVFFVMGVNGPEGEIRFAAEQGWLGNLLHFTDCVYYSIVTFTTLGYGEITPTRFARPVAAFEAFFGAFMMALFVAVFSKKMTRG